MIKGTNADCKILKVSVSETVATITLLIFATKATNPSKSFKIYIKDEGSNQYEEADPNVYWIDQINNYNFDSTNIDTKKYKEIMFNIDITKKNSSNIVGKKWVRNCYIILLDTSKSIHEAAAWSSDLLSLISDEFEIPEVINISMSTTNILEYILDQNDTSKREERGQIKVDFKLKYSSEKDFNYNNKNFKALLNIRSVSTDEVIESKEIATSSLTLENSITTSNRYSYNAPVVVEILITNKNGDIINDYRKIYSPFKKRSNTYIKTKDGVKKVIAYYISDEIVKVNYNNAEVKLPYKVVPQFFGYRTVRTVNEELEHVLVFEIDPRMEEEPFYADFLFEIYINGSLYSYIDAGSTTNDEGRYVVEIINNYELFGTDQLTIELKGKYIDRTGNEIEFYKEPITMSSNFVVNDELCCGEDIVCTDSIYGYYHNERFYAEKNFVSNTFVYDGEIDPETFNGYFIDLNENKIYEWDSENERYILLY